MNWGNTMFRNDTTAGNNNGIKVIGGIILIAGIVWVCWSMGSMAGLFSADTAPTVAEQVRAMK